MRFALLFLFVLLTAAAACAGGGDGDGEQITTGPAPLLALCAKAGPPIRVPEDLRENFPLPPGTRLTLEQRPYAGQLLLRGYIPGDIGGAAAFFKRELPDAGYELGRGDSERGEAEGLFTGNGRRGGWRVNAILGCPAVRLLIVLVEQG